jgi:large subunit ribosomal protein L31
MMRGLFPGLLANGQETTMKADTHPKYQEIKVVCSCGNSFTTRSTLDQELHIEVCSKCHPFYTGKQKIIDAGGRVDKFRRKYGLGAN